MLQHESVNKFIFLLFSFLNFKYQSFFTLFCAAPFKNVYIFTKIYTNVSFTYKVEEKNEKESGNVGILQLFRYRTWKKFIHNGIQHHKYRDKPKENKKYQKRDFLLSIRHFSITHNQRCDNLCVLKREKKYIWQKKRDICVLIYDSLTLIIASFFLHFYKIL